MNLRGKHLIYGLARLDEKRVIWVHRPQSMICAWSARSLGSLLCSVYTV